MAAADVTTLFHARPFTERCDRIRRGGEHALIGVSTGNSYFSAERLTALVRWAQQHFRAVDLICADMHVDTMLAADGATPEDSGRRARKRVKDVRRRIRQAVDAASPEGPAPGSHLLSDFTQLPEYRRLRAEIDRALDNDPEFAHACREMVRRYLLARPPSGENRDGDGETGRKMTAGLEYLGSELPFFVDTPSIIGVPSSVSCYHVSTPVVNALFRRNSGLLAAANQGFMVVAPKTPDGSSEPWRSDVHQPGKGTAP
ncbi:tRNA-dependent cyclodipeptide synthase [Streptomyces sp. HNM0574]|uniref:tRNA-dependent cyclodipeptide synthase n=1 Tax=Streptomyces sp. HNM0574 TaxID=2714954 RepID=UPI00146BADF3|nr:tRNA-dependent cyclodipeptide synthase [Streptomyces sp. HNM0574]NLU69401.1 tRNA-dependent cyclodipeptide synthase [Streptomyces sp. HNM0574]